jgi:hypothetical protein
MKISLTNLSVCCHLSFSAMRSLLSSKWMMLSLLMGPLLMLLKLSEKDLRSLEFFYLEDSAL